MEDWNTKHSQICGFASQILSYTHMITSNVRVKILTARSEKDSQNQAMWSSSRCNMYDPLLEPSLLILRFEILKRTSSIGLKPKWPPYFGMVNFMIIRGRYLKSRPTEWFAKGCCNLFIQQFVQKKDIVSCGPGSCSPSCNMFATYLIRPYKLQTYKPPLVITTTNMVPGGRDDIHITKVRRPRNWVMLRRTPNPKTPYITWGSVVW